MLGTVLDVAPALILAVPILLPLVKTLGVDPIHFGVIIVLNVVIGLITPPVAPARSSSPRTSPSSASIA